jgi:hypothetical protein
MSWIGSRLASAAADALQLRGRFGTPGSRRTLCFRLICVIRVIRGGTYFGASEATILDTNFTNAARIKPKVAVIRDNSWN